MKVILDQRTRVPRVPGWVIVIVIAWLSGTALLAVLARLSGTRSVPCHFRAVTGVPCATCGSTRAGLAVLEGRVIDAFLFNPLVVATVVIVAAILGLRCVTARQVVLVMSRRERIGAWLAAGMAFFGNWAYVIAWHAADATGRFGD